MENILGAYEQQDHIRKLQEPAMVPLLDGYTPPNMGPRTRAMVSAAVPAKNWNVILSDGGGFCCVYEGRLLDPPITGEKADESYERELKKNAPIVIYGIGSTQALHTVRAKTNRHILVYEPRPELLRAIIDARITMPGVTVTCDVEEFRELCAAHLGSGQGVTVLSNPAHIEMWPQEHDVFLQILDRLLQTELVTQTTITCRMREWIEHTLANLPHAVGARAAMALSRKYTGVPCVVVGAGPSLNKNLAVLKEFRDRVLVIATDLAGIALDKAGIVPDYYLTVEGKDLSDKIKTVSYLDKVPRLWTLACSPQSFKLGSGPLLYWFDSNVPFIGLAHEVAGAEGLPLGGSCTTAACLCAEAWGCNPIIMIGNDLVNAQEGSNYAGGVPTDGLAHRRPTYGKIGSWGDPSKLLDDSPVWCHARSWFELRAQRLSKNRPELVLYNCSEGGSHVAGWHDVPLRTVLEQCPISASAAAWLDQRKPALEHLRGVVNKASDEQALSDIITNAMKAIIPETIQVADVPGLLVTQAMTPAAQRLLEFYAAFAPLTQAATSAKEALDAIPKLCGDVAKGTIPDFEHVIAGVQVLTSELIETWLQQNSAALTTIEVGAPAVAWQCKKIGHMLTNEYPLEDLNELLPPCAAAEDSIRRAAATSQLFTGWTQDIAKEYNELFKSAVGVDLNNQQAGTVFTKKGNLYESMGVQAGKLRVLVEKSLKELRSEHE
jgi:hypothetical protein